MTPPGVAPPHPWSVLTHWDGSPWAIAAAVITAAVGVLYVMAASRPSPRGRIWPRGRTVCFLAGMLVLILVFDSGLQVYEDDPAIHVVQHLLTMMAAPPLLAFGAPITLLLRSLSVRGRRAVVRELHDPAFRLATGRRALVLVPLDYYVTMYLYQLTPVAGFAERHPLVHAAIHLYMLLCGVLFWLPMARLDPVRFRPSDRQRTVMIALGVPVFCLLGGIELARGHQATGWAYLIAGSTLTALGLTFTLVRAHRPAPAPQPA